MQVGSSDDPCSEIYHGERAGSEVEVQAITHYIHANAPIVAAIDFHSYYQEMLFPPGKSLTFLLYEPVVIITDPGGVDRVASHTPSGLNHPLKTLYF